MDSPVAKIASSKDLRTRDSDFKEFDIDEFLNDEERCSWILLAGNHYKNLLNEAIDDYFKVEDYSETTYLIDCDVLRDYLEDRPKNALDRFSIDSLFIKPINKFGIPSGAFLELLEYLSHLASIEPILPETPYATEILKHDDVFRQIAAGLRIKIDDDQIESLQDAILLKLRDNLFVLQRLMSILEHKKFIGVVSTDDSEVINELDKIISSVSRGHISDAAERTKKDYRDAMNLAIAVKSGRKARESRQINEEEFTKGFILITKTYAIVELPDRIRKDANPDLKLLSSLCEIMNVPEPFESIPAPPKVLSQHYTVLHPLRVAHLNKLGLIRGDKQFMFLKAREKREVYRKITEFFELKKGLLKKSSDTLEQAEDRLAYYHAQEKERIHRLVTDVSKSLYDNEQSSLGDIEHLRSTALSVDIAHVRQSGRELTYEETLYQSSIAFKEYFGQVLLKLEGISGTENFGYKCVYHDEPMPGLPFKSFEINQWLANNWDEAVISGELYLDSEKFAKAPFYTLRWAVRKDEQVFLKILKKIVVPSWNSDDSNVSAEARDFTLEPVTDYESSYWNEGIIITTNSASYGIKLDYFLKEGSWNLLSLEKIALFLRKASDDSLSEADNFIKQYRINTVYGDFAIDIEPLEELDVNPTRYITIHSHHNLTKQIATLFSYTGSGYYRMFSSSLSKALSEAIGTFKSLPKADA